MGQLSFNLFKKVKASFLLFEVTSSLETHVFSAWKHVVSYLDYLCPPSKCCYREGSDTESQPGAVSSSTS